MLETGVYSSFPLPVTSSRTIKVSGFPENRRKRGETVEEQIDLLSELVHIPVTFSSLVPSIDYKRGNGTQNVCEVTGLGAKCLVGLYEYRGCKNHHASGSLLQHPLFGRSLLFLVHVVTMCPD